MKYLSILLLSLLLYCCNSSTVTHKAESETNSDTLVEKNNNCTLKIDTFTFKNITIGMDLSKISNIEKTNGKYILNENMTNQCKVTTYSVTNVSDYSIFEKKIDKIELAFFNKKLFEITIELHEEIILDLAKKFDANGCIKDLDQSTNLPSLSIGNEKINLFYWGRHPVNVQQSLIKDHTTYYLNVQNNKVNKIVEYCMNKKSEEKDKNRLRDF